MSQPCTVLIRLKALTTTVDSILPKVIAAKAAVENQEGLLDAKLLVHSHGSELLNVLTWRSRDDHERCQTVPEVMMASMELLGLIQSGAINMSIDIYHECETTLD